MKIALIQTNPLIGAFSRNTEKMQAWLDQAKEAGCTLAIFPELAICGYPPQDLLDRPAFLRDHQLALDSFARQVHGIEVICGILEHHTGPHGKQLHNSAALIRDGLIIFTAQKRLLPTYDVFDEHRYFEPGSTSRVCTIAGITVALTVCEDIWNDADVVTRQLYPIDPVSELMTAATQRPELVINIAASPYHLKKQDLRRRNFSNLSRKHGIPLLYVNQVGGQDSLIFDGGSMVVDKDGSVAATAALFTEDMLVVELLPNEIRPVAPTTPPPILSEEAEIIAALTLGTRDYISKCGFNKVLVGLSGGIDSALTAAIASRAVGPDRVMGVALPSPYSSAESIEDARHLANTLGIEFTIIPITDIFAQHLTTLSPAFAGLSPDVTEQNLQARIRGTLLMALSNKFNRLLLTTGNKSEMAVGYCTLYGDMNGGLAVIADVPKQTVYRLARHLNQDGELIPQRTIDKAPSAELAPDQLDQDDLPPYETLDAILALYLEDNLAIDDIVGQGFERRTVEDIVRRVHRNEYKRKQAPMGLKITAKAFGYGRRYPTAEGFKELCPEAEEK